MGRKRNEDSSDEEFRLSDGSLSPAFSRLKRPRRSSTHEHLSLSPHPSSFQDDKDDVIHVPDSLDNEDDNAVIPDSAENSLANGGDTKSVSRVAVALDDDEDDIGSPLPNIRRASRQSDENAGPPALNVFDDNSRQADSVVGSIAESNAESVPGTDDEKDSPNSDGASRKPFKRIKERMTYAPSDSESDESDENSDGSDDDDAYISSQDSPDDDDKYGDSDFEASPKRAARKKASSPKKALPLKKPTRTSSAKKTQPNVTKTKKTGPVNKTKPTLSATKNSTGTMTRNPSVTPAGATNSSKRRLGARIPIRSFGISRPSGTSSNSGEGQGSSTASRASASTTPSPRFRAGLSRKAVVPRLHSYLPRK